MAFLTFDMPNESILEATCHIKSKATSDITISKIRHVKFATPRDGPLTWSADVNTHSPPPPPPPQKSTPSPPHTHTHPAMSPIPPLISL